jgi:hypothetical protein
MLDPCEYFVSLVKIVVQCFGRAERFQSPNQGSVLRRERHRSSGQPARLTVLEPDGNWQSPSAPLIAVSAAKERVRGWKPEAETPPYRRLGAQPGSAGGMPNLLFSFGGLGQMMHHFWQMGPRRAQDSEVLVETEPGLAI